MAAWTGKVCGRASERKAFRQGITDSKSSGVWDVCGDERQVFSFGIEFAWFFLLSSGRGFPNMHQ